MVSVSVSPKQFADDVEQIADGLLVRHGNLQRSLACLFICFNDGIDELSRGVGLCVLYRVCVCRLLFFQHFAESLHHGGELGVAAEV